MYSTLWNYTSVLHLHKQWHWRECLSVSFHPASYHKYTCTLKSHAMHLKYVSGCGSAAAHYISHCWNQTFLYLWLLLLRLRFVHTQRNEVANKTWSVNIQWNLLGSHSQRTLMILSEGRTSMNCREGQRLGFLHFNLVYQLFKWNSLRR